MKTNFLFTKQGFWYSKDPEGYLDRKSRILAIICQWVKRLQWVSCCSSNILLTPAPQLCQDTHALYISQHWGAPWAVCINLCRAVQTNQQPTPYASWLQMPCHGAAGETVGWLTRGVHKTSSPWSLVGHVWVDTKRGSSSLPPCHQVCYAFFKCI